MRWPESAISRILVRQTQHTRSYRGLYFALDVTAAGAAHLANRQGGSMSAPSNVRRPRRRFASPLLSKIAALVMICSISAPLVQAHAEAPGREGLIPLSGFDSLQPIQNEL